jgi:hypothetical protein
MELSELLMVQVSLVVRMAHYKPFSIAQVGER